MSQAENSSQNESAPRRRFRVTRRGFLIGLGATGATLALGVYLGRERFWRTMASSLENSDGGGLGTLDSDPLIWFEVTADNRIIMTNPKVEMGQGVHTSMAQVAAEELGIRWDQISVVQGGTHDPVEDGFGTGGSTSIISSYDSLRIAGATLREMLKIRGAEMLSVTVADVEAFEGTVRLIGNPSQQVGYGEIAASTTEWPELETEPVLKTPDQFEFIGKSLPRVDFESKLRGEAQYGYDLRVDGMVYGVIARPPTIDAKLISAKIDDAMERPGVLYVGIDEDQGLVGVVAETRQQARAGLGGIDIEWDEGKLWTQDEILDLMDVSERAGIELQLEGDALSTIGDTPTVSATYSTPFAAHAHLEAQAALADIGVDGAEIWSSTQGSGFVQTAVAEVTGLDADDIKVTPSYLGGGFGRKIGAEVAKEAAFLSQGAGRPVHVAWSRAEDMRNGFFRPPTLSALSGKVENGKIVAISHNHSSGPVAFPFFPAPLRALFGADFGSWRGSLNFYDGIANRRFSTHLAEFPIPTGWWRGLGLLANVFATESFMDELAHAAGADPLQFRLDHLGDDKFGQRMKAVLNAAAEKADYGKELPAGHAYGVACSVDVDTVAAMVVEVSVAEDGQVIVHRAIQAIDPGLVINPDGSIAQVQGSIVMGLSSTLIEELTIEEGKIRPTNFDRYPLITNRMAPEIEVVLLESDGKPRGMGEPPIGPVAAAVGNGVFNAIGKRIRELPITPEKILA